LTLVQTHYHYWHIAGDYFSPDFFFG
jgi:hypothetical protein